MAKDPAFLFYPGDYLRDTQTLSEKAQVAYDRIMCEHMRNTCISKQQLKFFTKRLNDEEIEELMFVLTEEEDGFCIDWVAESIRKRKAYGDSRRENRYGKKNKDIIDISETHLPHMENENENRATPLLDKDSFKKEDYSTIDNDVNTIVLGVEKNKRIDYNFIIELWNELTLLGKVTRITEKRKTAIKRILKDYSIEEVKSVFLRIAQSSFLNGGGDKGWLADFDWAVNVNNFVKITEGKYDNKAGHQNNSYGRKLTPAEQNYIRNTESLIRRIAADSEESGRANVESF
jgi:hypothetical protein